MSQDRKMEENRYARRQPDAMPRMDEEIDLRALLHHLYANRWLMIVMAVVGLLFSSAYLVLKVPQYSSNVLLQIQNQSNGLSALDGKSIFNLNAASTAQEVEIVLIKSRYVLLPVVQALGLDQTISEAHFPLLGAWYAKHHKDVLAKPLLGLSKYAWGGEQLTINQFLVPASAEKQRFTLTVGPAANEYSLYDAKQKLILNGKVGRVAQGVHSDGIYTLGVSELKANPGMQFFIDKRSPGPIINFLASALQLTDLGANAEYSHQSGVLQMSMTGENPDYIVKVLNTTAQVAVDKDMEKKSQEATKTLDFLNKQLPIVQQSLKEAEDKLNRYRSDTGKMDLNIQSRVLLSQIAETQKQLEEVRLSRAELLQKYTDQHPIIIGLNDKEKILQDEIKNLQIKISQLPAGDQQAVNLIRDVQVKSQLYMLLLNKIESLQVVKAGTISDLRILAWAEPPDGPNPVHTLFVLLGGLVAGFMLGVIIVLVRSFFHQKVMDPSVIESEFGLANMAIVPHSLDQDHVIATHNPKLTLIPLLAKNKPRDLAIEALRSFRTSLQFAMVDSPNNIVSIMGIAPGVGKSFISANFAYLLAGAGKSVLLIDGDIRKGHLKDYFMVGKCKGLTEVVSGTCTFEQALIRGPIETLDFLAAGAFPENPSEMLMSPKLKTLLDSVSKRYDMVIIDTAPILAVTDAAVIAQHAGANFLVLASNVHESDEIKDAIKRIEANGVRLNGAVFNFSKEQKGLYRYGEKYRYNYHYKYE